MVVVALVTGRQFEKLSLTAANSFRESITSSCRQELKNYIDLALSSIGYIYSYDNQGGGFVEYVWEKPSSSRQEKVSLFSIAR